MRNRTAGVVAAIALTWGVAARAELVDRVAAVVNKDIITLSEVERRAAPELARLAASEPDVRARAEQRQRVLKQTLETLIGEKLMEEDIKALGLTASDQEVQAALEDVRQKNNISDMLQFERMLSAEGLSLKTYREMLGKQIAQMKLMQMKVSQKVKVTEEDLKAAYTQYARLQGEDTEVKARHILVQVAPDAPADKVEAARKKAQALAEEARKPGVDFAELARARSEGSSRDEGGDLGYFRRGVMVPAFERAAFTLKVGEVSEPVRTSFGWHVLKVEERRAVDVPPYEQMKDELEARLRQEKMEKAIEQYVRELKQQASIEVKL